MTPPPKVHRILSLLADMSPGAVADATLRGHQWALWMATRDDNAWAFEWGVVALMLAAIHDAANA